ncbi:hypothetical protein HN385_02665 [archaeon]|jgi:hypothetical protein|nr:hypothetical protein [archaeon]MBT3450653.1 hypothetical protein [archaeon]MBT6868767.1 hypothetical protein [archaeon]MBT7193012.1 hypothetical protein [archaeon]MBT7380978.1 hypothetical protein [archaeon]
MKLQLSTLIATSLISCQDKELNSYRKIIDNNTFYSHSQSYDMVYHINQVNSFQDLTEIEYYLSNLVDCEKPKLDFVKSKSINMHYNFKPKKTYEFSGRVTCNYQEKYHSLSILASGCGEITITYTKKEINNEKIDELKNIFYSN